MDTVSVETRHYDPRTILFHWATVVLVTLQFATAWTIDDFPRGALRVDARSVHITLGVLVGLVLIARITWRLTGGRRLPPADRGILRRVAKATHHGLYLVLAAMVCAGLFLVWARGDSLYNVVTVPKFDPTNDAIREQAQSVHAFIGWVILAVAGVHASAALVHQYVWRDGLLSRMLPGRQRAA